MGSSVLDVGATGWSPTDFPAIDLVHREQPIPARFRHRVSFMLEQGVIERIGRGRGARLLLSRRFSRQLGVAGAYTRKRWLDHETNKALLLQDIRDCGDEGAPIAELVQVLPGLSRRQIRLPLEELRQEERVVVSGARRGARWRSVSRVA